MDFDELLSKIASDVNFRTKLATDPAAALQAAGVDATDERVAALKGIDYKSIEKVAEVFNKGEISADTAIC